MINLNSPQFSNSSKIDIAAHLSPSFRNKRVPSVQQIYSSSHWNRVNSYKKLDSPSKLSEKKRKRSQNSQHKNKAKNSQSMQNIATQMNFLRDQYKTLKEAYHNLIQQKLKNTEEVQTLRQQNSRLKEDNERLGKESEKLKNKIGFLQMEIERIRKQSCKLIQIEQFRTRKLEQNLMEKQKAISNLMSSLRIQNSQNSGEQASMLPTQSNVQAQDSYTFQAKQPNGQSVNGFHVDQSLTLSHDKTMSNHSQFISISLTSMMENDSVYRHDLSTKRNNLFNNIQSSVDNQNHKQQEKSLNNITSKLTNVKSGDNHNNNFKKLRKQIGKKIQVNIDEKHRQYVQNSHNPRTPLDRKTSKSTKASKKVLKRNNDDENCESNNRSSKKKGAK